MRVKITLYNEQCILPLNYQHQLQGFIYSMFDKKGFGKILHDEGFKGKSKNYKLFCFSNLLGKYEIWKKNIIFTGNIDFYIGTASSRIMQEVYLYLLNNRKIQLANQVFTIKEVRIDELRPFAGERQFILKTISPIVCYRTFDNKSYYFKPSDSEFLEICIRNLQEKSVALNEDPNQIYLEIEEVKREKQTIVYFKDSFFKGITANLKIKTNFYTLNLIYETGLGAKGPSGFGMVQVYNERNLPL